MLCEKNSVIRAKVHFKTIYVMRKKFRMRFCQNTRFYKDFVDKLNRSSRIFFYPVQCTIVYILSYLKVATNLKIALLRTPSKTKTEKLRNFDRYLSILFLNINFESHLQQTFSQESTTKDVKFLVKPVQVSET